MASVEHEAMPRGNRPSGADGLPFCFAGTIWAGNETTRTAVTWEGPGVIGRHSTKLWHPEGSGWLGIRCWKTQSHWV